jgi:hypothetical protein
MPGPTGPESLTMSTLSVKLPPPLGTAPDSPSTRPSSALDLAGDLVGCFSGGPADLASNPRHLDGFGQHTCCVSPAHAGPRPRPSG